MTTKATRLHRILGKQHFKKAYLREDGLITHQASSDDIVSHQRRTERESFEIASGKEKNEPPTHRGGFDATQYKKCTHCKQSRKLEYFGSRRIRGVVYVQSWCKFCIADYVAEQRRQSALILRG